jgi:tRNA (cytidine32/uridine32-2'-O)-methyltransferase
MQLENIRIILINTSHPGNIGSTARAMKTMGLSQLVLVNPLHFPDPKALEMASGAQDIIQMAKTATSLQAAIADCHLVIGASARPRSIPWPTLCPKTLATKVLAESVHSHTAIVFGREQSGLTNEELDLCHYCALIPANPLYSSLNLAQAVQVITYEIYSASLLAPAVQAPDYRLANAAELASFYDALETTLVTIDFLKLEAPRQLMRRLRRLFNRTRLDVMELNILRGMLAQIMTLLEKSKEPSWKK